MNIFKYFSKFGRSSKNTNPMTEVGHQIGKINSYFAFFNSGNRQRKMVASAQITQRILTSVFSSCAREHSKQLASQYPLQRSIHCNCYSFVSRYFDLRRIPHEMDSIMFSLTVPCSLFHQNVFSSTQNLRFTCRKEHSIIAKTVRQIQTQMIKKFCHQTSRE